MKSRTWTIRILMVLSLSLLSLLYAYVKQTNFLINYINSTFMFGLFFLMISGSFYVIQAGFFKVWGMGVRRLFKKEEDPYTDDPHWSNDNNNDFDEEKLKLREVAKRELFVILPFFVGSIMLFQSILFTILR